MIKLLQSIALPIICFLSACAAIPARQAPMNHHINWTARQKQLQKIQTWYIQGAIGIKTPQKSFSASLNWQQHRSHYLINLFGPLGIGAVAIRGQKGYVRLKTTKHQVFTAKSPEQLLQKQLGWHLPISDLHYWIRGLPVPNSASKKYFDVYHHLIRLEQAHWKIQYLGYTAVNKVDLPNKIFLTAPQLSLRIVISQW